MQSFKVISFNHQSLPFETVGKLHLCEESQTNQLGAIKLNFQFRELMFLSTCNRVELYILTEEELTKELVSNLISFINSDLSDETKSNLVLNTVILEGEPAVEHVFRVASSLNSLVIGEREIITQLRKSYDFCNMLGLTGDFIRLLIKQTIETSKLVFTKTNISKNPVSVVSLAYRQLRALGIKNDAKILVIGAGDTNTKMANYLQKHKFANFTIFNRTLEKALPLAALLKGEAKPLVELENFKSGFDVLIVCTASAEPIITQNIYKCLLQDDTSKKVLIDLSIPSNIDANVVSNYSNVYIDINALKLQAEQNMDMRKSEMIKCEQIIRTKLEEFKWLQKERTIELAFGEIPRQVKAIKDLAISEVFAKEIGALDPTSKEVLDKVIGYIEKKYNAVAMKTAKTVFLKNN